MDRLDRGTGGAMVGIESPVDQQRGRLRSTVLRSLYRPMLIASLLLHGVLFAIPMAESEPLEPEEEETVEITSLAPIDLPPPQPSPQATPAQPTPRPSVAPQVQPPPQQVIPRPAPQLQQPTVAPPTAFTPNPAPAPVEAPPAPVEPPPFDPAPFQQSALDGLGTLSGSIRNPNGSTVFTAITPDQSFFPNPPDFFAADGATLRAGILYSKLTTFAGDYRIDALTADIQRQFESAGNTFAAAGDYGGGALYEVKNVDGQAFAYVNIIPAKQGDPPASAAIVIWNADPRTL